MSYPYPSSLRLQLGSPHSLFLILFVISAQIQILSAFHWDGNVLYDLEASTTAGFTSEVIPWILSSYATTLVKMSTCGSSTILGGYNILGGNKSPSVTPYKGQYFQRTYSPLPRHNQIFLRMVFYAIDGWSGSCGDDNLTMVIDGVSVQQLCLSNANSTSDICGNNTLPDTFFTLYLVHPHTASSMTIQLMVSSEADSQSESFGFKNIQIDFMQMTDPYQSLCNTANLTSSLSCLTTCSLAANTMNPSNSGLCYPTSCSSNCESCSSTSSLCTNCYTNYYLTNWGCYSSCPASLANHFIVGGVLGCYPLCNQLYIMWDNTCNAVCSFTTSSGIDTFQLQAGSTDSILTCAFPCGSQFLYWNGSCLSTCPSPLTSVVSRSRKFCAFGCAETQYLYWNGSCLDDCESGLRSEVQGTVESRQFCWSPCQIGEYIYWNSSCLLDCPYPLSSRQDPQMLFCENPCHNSTLFILTDQSCSATCSSPLSLITQPGAQFCVSPCNSSTLFLYSNGSCLENCTSPFITSYLGGVYFCNRLCEAPSPFWYHNNGSCLASCPAPYVQSTSDSDTVLQCSSPCSSSEWYYSDENACYQSCSAPYKRTLIDEYVKVCSLGISVTLNDLSELQDTVKSIETQGSLASGAMKIASVLNSQNPSSALLSGLSSMMQYIRYMKIDYPPRVQALFLVSAGSPVSLNFGVAMPSFLSEHLSDEPLPDTFDKYEINSNFVTNLWDFIVSFGLILLLILITMVLIFMLSGWHRARNLSGRVLKLLKWNVPVTMLCGSSGDIVFYAYLQLESSFFQNRWSTISCTVTLILLFFVALLLTMAVIIVVNIRQEIGRQKQQHQQQQQQQQKKQKQKHNSLHNNQDHEQKVIRPFKATDRWPGLEVLFDEYEEESLLSLAYLALFISRGVVFNLTLAALYQHPLIQGILLNVCNLTMVCYLIYYRPLKQLFALVQLWVTEGLVAILSISVLILAVLDRIHLTRKATRAGLGEVIIFVIKMFNTVSLVLTALFILKFLFKTGRTYFTFRKKRAHIPEGNTSGITISSSMDNKAQTLVDTNTWLCRSTTNVSQTAVGTRKIWPSDCSAFCDPSSFRASSQFSLELKIPNEESDSRNIQEPMKEFIVISQGSESCKDNSPQSSEGEVPDVRKQQERKAGENSSWSRPLRKIKKKLDRGGKPIKTNPFS